MEFRTTNDFWHQWPISSPDEAIREKFTPVVISRKVSDVGRRILDLPVRLGGIGIQNPVLSAEREHNTSVVLTENLSTLIYNQERTLVKYEKEKLKTLINSQRIAKDKRLAEEKEEIKTLGWRWHERVIRISKRKSFCFMAISIADSVTGVSPKQVTI